MRCMVTVICHEISGQNLAKLKFEVEKYLKNHVQINQDVISANTNNFCNNLFVIYSHGNVTQSRKKNILQDFASHGSPMLLWFR